MPFASIFDTLGTPYYTVVTVSWCIDYIFPSISMHGVLWLCCGVTKILVRGKNRSGRTKIFRKSQKILVRAWNTGPVDVYRRGSADHRLSHLCLTPQRVK